MLQCKDCEFFQVGTNGAISFKCDPFTNIKEPECIAKWQIIRLDMLLASYKGMLHWYEKMSPLQDKLFKYMQREIDDMNESENWRLDNNENDEDKL